MLPTGPQAAAVAWSAPTMPAPRRVPWTVVWLLRGMLSLHALQAVAQPVLIGGYLDGAYDLIGAHGLNGSLLMVSLMLTGVAALLYWALGGRGWIVAALVPLWFVEGFQIGMGYARALWIHVPLGVTVVAATVALAAWSWTRNAHRPRGGWWR